MTNSTFFHDGFRDGRDCLPPSPPDIPVLADEYMAGFGAGLVAALDAIPAEERRDLTKAFAKGFNEVVNK